MESSRKPASENWSALSNLRVSPVSGAASAAPAAPPEQTDRTGVAGTPSSVKKTSLSFILDDQAVTEAAISSDDENKTGARLPRSRSTGDLETKAAAPRRVLSATAGSGSHSRRAGKVVSDAKRRRPPSRICKHDGCEQYVVDQGLCVRHGGGKRCQTEGCTSRAKHQGKCWRHGGSTECKVPNCANRAKSRGFCWSHGGGTKCKAASCEKIAISNGLCWAHGGGKRCIVKNCMRQAYERTNNLCNSHYQEWQHGVQDMEIDESDEMDESKPPPPPPPATSTPGFNTVHL